LGILLLLVSFLVILAVQWAARGEILATRE
jgi:hypothetical protein